MDNTSPVERSEDHADLTNDEIKHSFSMTSWRNSRLRKIKTRYSAFKEEVDSADENLRTMMCAGMVELESRFQNVLRVVKVTSHEDEESLVDRVFLHDDICKAFNWFDESFFEQQKHFRDTSKVVNKANKKIKESTQNILAATLSNQLPRGMARQLAKQEMLCGNMQSNTTGNASVSKSNLLRSSDLTEWAASPNASSRSSSTRGPPIVENNNPQATMAAARTSTRPPSKTQSSSLHNTSGASRPHDSSLSEFQNDVDSLPWQGNPFRISNHGGGIVYAHIMVNSNTGAVTSSVEQNTRNDSSQSVEIGSNTSL